MLADDNQGTLQSDGMTLANNSKTAWLGYDCGGFIVCKAVAPDSGEERQSETILGLAGSVADDADDDSNDTSGDPGAPTPQTAPNNDWNEVYHKQS